MSDKFPFAPEHRNFLKSLFSNRQNFPPQLKGYLKKYQDEIRDRFEKQFPLTDRFYSEDMILSWFFGETSEQEIIAELKKGFIDVGNFVGAYIDGSDELRLALQRVIKTQANVEGRIAEIQRQISDARDAAEAAGLNLNLQLKRFRERDDYVIANRLRHLQEYFEKERDSIEKIGISHQEWEGYVVNSEFLLIPSLDCYLSSLREYLLYIAINMNRDGQFPKQKKSDTGDLVHAYYVPYVDVFRADRSFAAPFACCNEV